MTPWIPRGWPNEEFGPVKSYTFTMRTAVSFDAGDEVIMSIAGHVSRTMLSRYSHVRMEAKRRALDEIATPRVQPTRSARRKRNGTHRPSMRRSRSSRFAGNRWRAGKPIWIRRCSDGLLAHPGRSLAASPATETPIKAA
jgi:hypothetical protein